MAGQSIRIEDLEKRFDRTRVLHRINLNIREGEFLTLLGPSGCGKSTLLRLIAGFEASSAGRILIGDRDVTPLPPKARDIAMVFQSYALYPHMTVRANIGVPLEMARLSFLQRLPGATLLSATARQIRSGIEKEIDSVAEQLGLKDLLGRKPSQLSGGQRQRVAVGRAMVRHPAVFLMDEPLSNLDAKLRIQLREEIVDLHRRTGITFIYVTHDQTEAMAMSDRIAVMEGGEIRQCGTPDEIYNRPDYLSVARFVGMTAINEIPVHIHGGNVLINGQPLRLRLRNVADGTYTLSIRPEALEPISEESSDFSLPVVQVEFAGNEVGIRCDGSGIGTGWIRAQLRPETFARLEKGSRIGERLALRIVPDAALLFDAAGRRVADIGVNAQHQLEEACHEPVL
ncbi:MULTISPECIES: ABC transporter ATP-binding protein [unclassified Rhizobium]|uniref:ABC transporter ATP-binding protein n=1 Tax=unclassified Rhizobium TaxID=2613769 RepID=UPI002479D0EB|nr:MULTISPECIES: ABC transporter ATP-binding protein [unclassified Rhizobium]MDH7803246.1 multiple sugar transport system ATP-binding protein [Rhizobium sp. AN70]